MKIIFALFIILLLVFSGYHLTFRRFRLLVFARRFYLTGTEFLFLGLLLGPQSLNILDVDAQKGLAPCAALVLGWIGLIYGFQFEIKKLRRLPLDFFLAASLEGLVTLTLVFIGVYMAMIHYFAISHSLAMVVAITLGAAAGCTAQTALAFLPADVAGRRPDTTRLLRFISSIDGMFPLLIFGLCFSFNPSVEMDGSLLGGFGQGILSSLVAGLGLLFLFALFISHRRLKKDLILIVIGMTLLASGLALVLRFSPLLINFFVGFWLVNLSLDKERIYQILMTVEKPTYLLLLVFLGVHLSFDAPGLLFIGIANCLYRVLGKTVAGFVVTRLNPNLQKYPALLGFGLLAQGGLSLAILLDFQLTFHCPVSTRVISIAVIAVICNEFLSPYFLERMLKTTK
ncbi:MAG: hypothetical protein V2J25_10135 [Desulfatiglans sp.]|jgi:hypothetical protein|nr:hypothetical protein [Desulfatiglans sp.]